MRAIKHLTYGSASSRLPLWPLVVLIVLAVVGALMLAVAHTST